MPQSAGLTGEGEAARKRIGSAASLSDGFPTVLGVLLARTVGLAANAHVGEPAGRARSVQQTREGRRRLYLWKRPCADTRLPLHGLEMCALASQAVAQAARRTGSRLPAVAVGHMRIWLRWCLQLRGRQDVLLVRGMPAPIPMLVDIVVGVAAGCGHKASGLALMKRVVGFGVVAECASRSRNGRMGCYAQLEEGV
ncbi:hypothetical protein HWV62_42181 [Athelia sp. TMB]|nr:hypothetical protein HWV62_42181 [Athelia sp. TMB]